MDKQVSLETLRATVRKYAEFTLRMAHCTFKDDVELEVLRQEIEDMIRVKYPDTWFKSDIEVEVDFHSGLCTNATHQDWKKDA